MFRRMIILIMILISILIGCSENVEKDVTSKDISANVIRNVKIMTVSSSEHINYGKYVGTIIGSGIQKMSFEVGGKIIDLPLKAGNLVKEGDLLGAIDPENLLFVLDAANAEYQVTKSQYSKANESLNFAKNLYERTVTMFNDGVASQQELDQVSLNYNISQDDLGSALGLKNQAYTNVRAKTYMLSRSSLYATRNGIVVEVTAEEGEMIGAGYPIVIMRSEFLVMSFGVSQSDMKFLEIDQSLDIRVDNNTYTGMIDFINQVPDLITQTYEVKVKLDNKDIPLGSVAVVYISTEKVIGTLIPLGAIRSDGADYVYIVVEGVARRLNISVLEVLNQMVIVAGIEGEVSLIVDGIMNLHVGDKVNIIEE